MLRKLDHIGIAVEDLEESTALWTEVLGFRLSGQEILIGSPA